MEALPSTHFVRLARAILYREVGFGVVWPDFAAVVSIGALFFAWRCCVSERRWDKRQSAIAGLVSASVTSEETHYVSFL